MTTQQRYIIATFPIDRSTEELKVIDRQIKDAALGGYTLVRETITTIPGFSDRTRVYPPHVMMFLVMEPPSGDSKERPE